MIFSTFYGAYYVHLIIAFRFLLYFSKKRGPLHRNIVTRNI